MDVSQLPELAIVGLARATLATVPVFLIVLAATSLGRRWLAPWARQALWSLVLLRLLLPVSIGSPTSLQPGAIQMLSGAFSLLKPAQRENPIDLATGSYTVIQDAPDAQAWAPAIAPPAVSTFDWFEFTVATLIPGVLLGGMLLVAIWTAITTWRLSRWVRSGSECQREEWLTLLAEGQRRFGVNGKVPLRTVPALAGPATYGWWRPAILLPDDAATWSSTQLRHVLWHELAHIRRRDVATNWVLALIRVVHWWNPMFWWAQRAWLAERELACDALVLQQLAGDDVREYGQTLLHFLQRLASSAGLPAFAPGFVLFWGRKREARRRLAELASLARPERKWRRWLAGTLIAALAVTGLTDAAMEQALPPASAPLELPAGTTWSVLPTAAPDHDAPRSSAVYPLLEAIERLRKDDPELSAEMAALELQLIVQQMIHPNLVVDPATGEPRTLSTCAVQDEQLVVRATAAQHDEVRRLLALWTQAGLRQVSIEQRFLTTGLSLKELLPGAGGTVLNMPGVIDELSQANDPPAAALQAWTQSNTLAFMRLLNPEEAKALCDELQADARSNLLFAPKLTVFDGMSASLLNGVQRPFVTGMRSCGGTAFEPQISVVSEGIQIQLRTQLAADGQATQLFLHYQESNILSVEVLETMIDGDSHNVQIPHVSRSVVATTAEIPMGHSLLVAPLRRDAKGQLHLCLIKPLALQ
jgi:beta-lactamase regulating signal transducer with metallopeptidase domain